MIGLANTSDQAIKIRRTCEWFEPNASMNHSIILKFDGLLPAVVVDDERSAGVPEAGVHLPGLVARAEHLRVQLEQDKDPHSKKLWLKQVLRQEL